jgi:hypothetical protein
MSQEDGLMTPEQIAEDMAAEKEFLRRSARDRLIVRSVFSLLVLALGAWFLTSTRLDIQYYLKKGSAPKDLGDLRSESFDPKGLEALGTNDYVRFSNDVLLFEEYVAMGGTPGREGQEGSGTRVYYSPLTHFVVATNQPLPDKTAFKERDSLIQLDKWGLDMVVRKQAFAWDVMVAIGGEGRLLAYDDIPPDALPAISFMSNSGQYPKEKMFLFLDGEKPGDRQGLPAMVGLAVLIVALSVAFWAQSLVRYVRCR